MNTLMNVIFLLIRGLSLPHLLWHHFPEVHYCQETGPEANCYEHVLPCSSYTSDVHLVWSPICSTDCGPLSGCNYN